MAKKDAYYFPHDSNAKDDPKCMHLIESLGLEGYGIYWVLVESLRDQPSYKYPIKMIPAIARKYNTTTDKVSAVVLNYSLFDFDDEDFFFSNSLIERMIPLENKRVKARIAGLASAEKRKHGSTTVQRLFNACSTDVEPIEKSKIENSKTKDNKTEEAENLFKESVLQFSEFWNIYAKKVDSKKCEDAYKKISEVDRQKIKDVVSKYVKSTPETKYRKNPLTWINGKCWNDEIAETKVQCKTQSMTEENIDYYKNELGF